MTISTVPTTPLPAVSVALTSSLAGPSDRVQWELTAKPSGSALALGVLRDTAGVAVATLTPDVAGEYTISAAAYRPMFDPLTTYRTGEEAFRASDSGTVHVAAAMDLPILTTAGVGATLRLGVQNETVVSAVLVKHTSEPARVAALDAAVVAALAVSVGVVTTAIGTELQAGANDLRTKYAAHIALVGAVHSGADTTNTVRAPVASSDVAAVAILTEIHDRLLAHYLQRSSLGATLHVAEDGKNLPAARKATDKAGAYVMLADLRVRCFARHLLQVASPAVHGAADNTNALTGAARLDTIVATYLDALVAAGADAPAGEAEGARDIAAAFGFRAA